MTRYTTTLKITALDFQDGNCMFGCVKTDDNIEALISLLDIELEITHIDRKIVSINIIEK